MDVADDAAGSLDPRIQIELENLNNATDDINKLETELDEAHTAFRQLLCDTTRRLKEITDKLGTSCIEKARCYYEALELARQAQVQCQQQAQLFQRASEIHAAAKETVALAEARFISHQHEWNFDQAWQDMLNHATIKVMDAENQKAECGREHHRRAMLFHDAEKKLLQLEEKHRRGIIKARPYFEVKTQCDQMLATQKERVEYLQQTVKEAKSNYARSLRTLEEISNQIHEQRRDYDIVVNGPREPGVGAELISSETYQKCADEFISSENRKISFTRYSDTGDNEKLQNVDKLCSIKEDTERLDKRSVDGSESISTQWELEMQTSLEKLNRLSLENPLSIMERDSARSCSDLPDATESDIVKRPCHNILSGEQFNAHSLHQFSTNRNLSVTLKKDTFIDKLSPLQRSYSTSITTVTLCSKPKTALKCDVSKSLTNSPVSRNASYFENKRIIKKTESGYIHKHVPNSISESDINNSNVQSSWSIDASCNINDISEDEGRFNNSNTNDIIDDKSRVQLTNLPYVKTSHNVEFLPAKSDLSEEHNFAASAAISQYSVNLQNDVKSLETQSSSNTVQNTSCSANTSPMRIKKALTSIALYSDNEIISTNERSIPKKFGSIASSIKELPLLSFFGRTSALGTIKSKSCSMIDLDNKQNLKTLLDNSHLGNIQAVSAERLANIRHKLVNDYSEIKADDIKK